jgi:hypothetical protein
MHTQRFRAQRVTRQENTAVLTWLAIVSPFALIATILLAQAYGWR